MSRDFTPYECYQIDKAAIRNGRGSVTEAVLSLVDAETGKLVYEEAQKHYKQFPILVGLLTSAANFYKDFEKAAVDKVFEDIEKQLKENAEKGTETPDKEVGLWFHGKLVEGYYMTENDNSFYEFLKGKVEQANGKIQ